MKFILGVSLCVGLVFWSLALFADDNQSQKVEGVYRDSLPIFTKDGKKLGVFNAFNFKEKFKEKLDVIETTPRKLVGIRSENLEKEGEIKYDSDQESPDDKVLWLRAGHLRLSSPEQPVCPEVPTRSASMTEPIASGIGCR